LAGDGYLRVRVAVLQVLLKAADRLLACHDAALSGRRNLLHLIRVPLRVAVQPVPVR
jgi:hypothetical protein